MQTFLPYPDFVRSAAALDYRRLGKQRIEAKQILTALEKPTDAQVGWANHPATLMWKSYSNALAHYGIAICKEWIDRGYVDHQLAFFEERAKTGPIVYPAWFGNPNFHAAHRSNLLRKNPVHYGPMGWAEPNDLPYIWPGEAHEDTL